MRPDINNKPGRFFSEDLTNFLLIPARLFLGMLKKDTDGHGTHFISLSPSLNSVNDHTGVAIKRFAFDRYGFWGYYPRCSLGTNYGATYGFLPNLLLWKLGVCGYTLFSLLAYGILFFLIGRSETILPWTIYLVGALALYSPYFKNSTFACGRFDIPGWAFLMAGICAAFSGDPILEWIFLSLAFMTHPSVCIIGSVYFVLFLFFRSFSVDAYLSFAGAHLINLFWYIPFYRIFVKSKESKKPEPEPTRESTSTWQWSAPAKDNTRSTEIHLIKIAAMLLFIFPVVVVQPDPAIYPLLLVPFGFQVLSARKEVLINRFSIELLWLTSAAVALALTGSLLLSVPYLVSLYFYASPSSRFGFPFKPFFIRKDRLLKSIQPANDVIGEDSRIGFVYLGETAEAWRSTAKYSTLFSNWILLQPKRIERVQITAPFIGGEIVIPNDCGLNAALTEIAQRHAISHFIIPSEYASRLGREGKIKPTATFTIPTIGSVPKADFSLLCTEETVAKIEPEGTIVEDSEGLFIIHCEPGRHEIKYQPMFGLRAFQSNEELPLKYGGKLNFFIFPQSPDPIRIFYDAKCLWNFAARTQGK